MATLTVPVFTVQTDTGEEGSFGINSHADLILRNPARNNGGRALVVASGGDHSLIINYDNDFKDGVVINGLRLHLGAPPPGTPTDFVRIDDKGRLYRQD